MHKLILIFLHKKITEIIFLYIIPALREKEKDVSLLKSLFLSSSSATKTTPEKARATSIQSSNRRHRLACASSSLHFQRKVCLFFPFRFAVFSSKHVYLGSFNGLRALECRFSTWIGQGKGTQYVKTRGFSFTFRTVYGKFPSCSA